jgi:hypothetical protein
VHSQSLFKIESGEEGDVQLATLLNVGIETIKASFTQLWADQARLKALIKGLTALKDDLTAIKTLFSALSQALSGIVSDTQTLLATWTDVDTRLATVENIDRNVTDSELRLITRDWAEARDAATAYINAVSGTRFAKIMSGRELLERARMPRQDQVPKVPRTKGEIEMARLLATLESQIDDSETYVDVFMAGATSRLMFDEVHLTRKPL